MLTSLKLALFTPLSALSIAATSAGAAIDPVASAAAMAETLAHITRLDAMLCGKPRRSAIQSKVIAV